MILIFLLGLILGACGGVSFTMAWHHRMLADGFLYLARVTRGRKVTDVDVSRAFGFLRDQREETS